MHFSRRLKMDPFAWTLRRKSFWETHMVSILMVGASAALVGWSHWRRNCLFQSMCDSETQHHEQKLRIAILQLALVQHIRHNISTFFHKPPSFALQDDQTLVLMYGSARGISGSIASHLVTVADHLHTAKIRSVWVLYDENRLCGICMFSGKQITFYPKHHTNVRKETLFYAQTEHGVHTFCDGLHQVDCDRTETFGNETQYNRFWHTKVDSLGQVIWTYEAKSTHRVSILASEVFLDTIQTQGVPVLLDSL